MRALFLPLLASALAPAGTAAAQAPAARPFAAVEVARFDEPRRWRSCPTAACW
ncbi:hypothetical protein H1235_16900 [Pseudoxanthomonas sp. NC8]|nr:hypothetical protein H1235_16900 [Pseudoxanthomonas sp. NC8]